MSSYWSSMEAGNELHAIDDTLFIGSMEGRLYLVENGIQAIVSCLSEGEHARMKPLCPLVDGNVVEHPVVMDDTTVFDHDVLHTLVSDTVAFIRTQLALGRRVLVHCAAGISRSATIVIAYLMQRDGLAFPEALQRVREVRPFVRPNSRFEAYLRWRALNVPSTVARLDDWQDDPRFAAAVECPIHQVDDTLFIGRLRIAQHGIKTVVACLTEDEWHNAPAPPDGVTEHVVCLADTTRLPQETLHIIISSAVADIEAAVARGDRVFVHCMAGISRSSTVVLAYLMKRDSIPFLAALQKLEAIRYCVCPNTAFQTYLRWRETCK